MFRSLFSLTLLSSLTLLTACETGGPIFVKDPQLVAQPDKVSMMLAQAADKAANALEELSAVEQKRTPAATVAPIVGAPPELNRAVTVNWIGPADRITKMMADRAGYKFAVLGAVPVTPIVVSIDVTNKPVVEVLRSIGLQLGARANVHVDAARRVVEMNYTPVMGLGDVMTPAPAGM